jgi:hypothetical protein
MCIKIDAKNENELVGESIAARAVFPVLHSVRRRV